MEAVTVSRYSQCHTQDGVTIARDDSSACLLQMFAHCLESKIRTFSNRRARMTVVSHGRWSVAISTIRRQSVQSLALLGMNGSIPMLTDCTPARWYVGVHKVSSNDWTVKETPQWPDRMRPKKRSRLSWTRWETGGQSVVSLTVTLVTCRNGMFWRTDSCGLKEPCSRWRHLANTSERSSRGGSRTITCYFKYLLQLLNKTTFKRVSLSLAIQIFTVSGSSLGRTVQDFCAGCYAASCYHYCSKTTINLFGAIFTLF